MCNQLLVSKVIFKIVTRMELQDRKLVFFREPPKFLIYLGTMEKYKAKSFLEVVS